MTKHCRTILFQRATNHSEFRTPLAIAVFWKMFEVVIIVIIGIIVTFVHGIKIHTANRVTCVIFANSHSPSRVNSVISGDLALLDSSRA
jgi:hypothetical protein